MIQHSFPTRRSSDLSPGAGNTPASGLPVGELTPEELDHLMGRVESEATRMGLLVEDLLLLARLDQQRPLERTPIDLLEIARQDRPSLYHLCAPKPTPLIAPDLKLEAAERTGPEGIVEPLAERLAEEVRAYAPTVVVSAAVGGIVLGYEMGRRLGTRAIFVEKEGGAARLRRGFKVSPADRVLVVEDVITTGGSVNEVIDVVREAGAQVVAVGALVRRAPVDFGVPTHVLLDLPIASWDPAECPLCADGRPLTEPGSRFIGQSARAG